MTPEPWDLGRGRSARQERSRELDEWLAGLVGLGPGIALAAVGGLGRSEMGPRSDLDLVLLHEPGDLGDLPDRIWYPIWDAGHRLDHSVRTPAQARRMAAGDIKVFLGLLDLRPVVGDVDLVVRLRSSILADWRALAAKRLPELAEAAAERARRSGSVAHLLEPDLKESAGGLRDLTVLRAIAAASLTDLPHESVDLARGILLDVRDAIAEVGSGGNRLTAHDRDAVAEKLGIGADDLLQVVSRCGRSVGVASDEVWHRVGRLAAPNRRLSLRRRGDRVPIADGVVVQDNEVMLALDANPSGDPTLLLRAAAAAAQSGRRLSPHTVSRLASESAPLPEPWPSAALTSFVALLGSGAPLVPVWEALDQAGVISRLLPGWERVRSLPQHSPVHRFALDRHLVETTVLAAAGAREVARPDLLLISALLHDIGKGLDGDHSVVGADIADGFTALLGLPPADQDIVHRLVLHHLLLADTATRRDLDDPATIANVTQAVGDAVVLELLAALTVADAAATGPGAWSSWKAGLVSDLVARCSASLAGRPSPPRPKLDFDPSATGVEVRLTAAEPGWDLLVAAEDRPGLLAAVAGVLAGHRLAVRSAVTETVGARAATVWRIEPLFGEPPQVVQLRADLVAALSGTNINAHLAQERRGDLPPARAAVVPDASERATVIEVRAHDEPGLLHRIATALTAAEVDVVAARISTFGAEAVDVFYVVGPDGNPLDSSSADSACRAVGKALT